MFFRDIFFCSSEIVSNSIARASYWLVRLLKMLIKETLTKTRLAGNSTVEVNSPGRLTRSHPFSFVIVVIIFKTQNKVNPLEEVTCVALRRSLLLCGTEGGRILGFNCSGD